ncbi:MAG: hypothetical protein CK425_07695 [Parachlamydia sp.]|nr:MAG: hypothetical protein CK425_07695 [Parachlamydia sp.]
MLLERNSQRSSELELLDLGPSYYSQEEYTGCLHQLARIGRFLGGDKATLDVFTRFPAPSSILDVGCGGGQFTLQLAEKFPQAQVTGIDISSQAIDFAQKQLEETQLTNVTFEIPPSVHLLYPANSFDVVTATLVCHHMEDAQLIDFLRKAYAVATHRIILNDLHRHWLAYLGFFLIAKPCFANRLIAHDGLLSIKRAFKKKDWIHFLQAAGIPLEQCSITWHWAFRWVVCINTSDK